MNELRDMTTKELCSLPEMVDSEIVVATSVCKAKELSDELGYKVKLGDTVRLRIAQEFHLGPTHPKDPAFWRDEDGRAWTPVFCEFQWRKQRAPLFD